MRAIAPHALAQRVLVRMLYDPVFCEAVYADAAGVLGALGLDAGTAAQIVAHDRRAFSVDPWRGHRAVTAALGEAAVTALAMTRLGVAAGDHMDFIAGPHFHRCVMERGVLVTAFFDALAERVEEIGGRLGAGASRRERAALSAAWACLALERAVAEVRRARPRPGGSQQGGRVVRGAVRAVAIVEGASAAWGRARQALGADPVASLVSGGSGAKTALAALFGTELGPGTEWVLIERPSGRGQEPVISFTGEALAGLLSLAATPVPREVLVGFAETEGASRVEAEEIVDELLADGLLISELSRGERRSTL